MKIPLNECDRVLGSIWLTASQISKLNTFSIVKFSFHPSERQVSSLSLQINRTIKVTICLKNMSLIRILC